MANLEYLDSEFLVNIPAALFFGYGVLFLFAPDFLLDLSEIHALIISIAIGAIPLLIAREIIFANIKYGGLSTKHKRTQARKKNYLFKKVLLILGALMILIRSLIVIIFT